MSTESQKDIEDFIFQDSHDLFEPTTTTTTKKTIPFEPKTTTTTTINNNNNNNNNDNNDNNDNDINNNNNNNNISSPFDPKTIFVKTWGCSHNISDSEYMAGLLSQNGYSIITEDEKKNSCDLWLLNSCTVKGPSQDHFLTLTRKAKASKKPLVVCGCVPQGQKTIQELDNLSIIGVQQIDRVVEVVDETLKGNTMRLLNEKRVKDETGKRMKRKSGGADLSLPKIRKNKHIEIIPINTGCLNQCTYCKTKHARGDLGSYPIVDIVSRIRQVREDSNVKEIWLTSEDTGAYGLDIDTDISELLSEICHVLDEEDDGLMVRIGMTNPPYILNHLESIAKALNHPHIYAFLHIPVQSASDMVLADMKRKYTIKDFETVVDYMTEHVPRIHIATDIICGFPTETEECFERTLELIKKYKFPALNISQFYSRPGTVAARMKKLDSKIVKNRSRRVTQLFKSYISFEERIGEIHNVLITEKAKDNWHFVGHNKTFDHFLIPPIESEEIDVDLMGLCVEIQIESVGKYFLKGNLTSPCRKNLLQGTWNSQKQYRPTDGLTIIKKQHSNTFFQTIGANFSLIRTIFVWITAIIVFIFTVFRS